MGAEHLKAVRRAARRRVIAGTQFRMAVIEAHQSGESLRSIAAEAGMSHVAVLKIVRGAEGA